MLTAIMVTFIVASVITYLSLYFAEREYNMWPVYIQPVVIALALLYIFIQGVMVGLKGY